jgi:hypothetical protein
MKEGGSRLISNGAMLALAGYILSGLVGTLLVLWLHPQPTWVSPQVYAQHYHFLQSLPFYFGFLLVIGMLMLAAGHYLNTDEREKAATLLSLMLTTAFAALIFFNYIVQTTYVRGLALNYTEANNGAISMFAMSNPTSLCWAIEMWGYAILGIATALLYPYYKCRSTITAALLLLNCVVSLTGVVAVVIDAAWVFTTSGLACYAGWNVLMIVLMLLIYKYGGMPAVGAHPSASLPTSAQVT